MAIVGGIAAALVLAPALGASAAPFTSDVVPDTWVNLDATNMGSPFVPLVPAGPAAFPVTPTVADTSFAASGLTVGTPEGCTRLVNGITVTLTSSPGTPLGTETGIGSTASLGLTADFEFDYGGDGVADLGPGFVKVDFASDDEDQTGTLTITLDEAIPASEAFVAIGAFYAEETVLTIDSVTFTVTDDCPVPAPASVPVPVLAATGTDVAPMLGAGAALVLLGAAATMVALHRRTA